MKFEYYDDKIVVYIIENKKKSNIENLLFIIFDELVNKYDICLSDSYDITIYFNNNYGIVSEIKEVKDNLKFNNKVNIYLKVVKDKLFLYEVDDPLDYKEDDVYYYDSKFYISPKNKNIKLFEYAKVIYDDFVYKVLGRGVKI